MRGGVRIRLVGIRSRVHGRERNLPFVHDSALQALRLQLRRERVPGTQRTGERRGRFPVQVFEVQGVQRDRFSRSGEHLRSKIQRNRISVHINLSLILALLLLFHRFWSARRRRTRLPKTWPSLARTGRSWARLGTEGDVSTGTFSSLLYLSWRVAWGTYSSASLWGSIKGCTTSPITSFCLSRWPIYSSACSSCLWARSQASWVSVCT